MQALLVIAWMLSGAAIAIVMVLRGHSPHLWWFPINGGPLLALLAVNAKDEEARLTERTVREVGPHVEWRSHSSRRANHVSIMR